ncbi:MAG: archaemetzincin family Zn-dependent metalloprotease [Syntrophobacterales bacterium]|jgi:archaemetzincin|nr:archaemetzincin family Zn-dependent metalloprotease [Syntrophobacterales bacterium]
MPSFPFLGLVALGPVDPEILRQLRAALTKILALPARVLRPKPLPQQAYHAVRQQYHSTRLLEYLLTDDDSRAYRILGITTADLFIPIFTFVFGEAQLEGKAAVISMCRLRGEIEGFAPSKSIFLRRLLKLSLHELGHTFGLGHCRQDGCLSGFSANLEILDRKNLAFCQYCQALLADHFRDQGLDQVKRYGETPAPGAPIPTADRPRRHRR